MQYHGGQSILNCNPKTSQRYVELLTCSSNKPCSAAFIRATSNTGHHTTSNAISRFTLQLFSSDSFANSLLSYPSFPLQCHHGRPLIHSLQMCSVPNPKQCSTTRQRMQPITKPQTQFPSLSNAQLSMSAAKQRLPRICQFYNSKKFHSKMYVKLISHVDYLSRAPQGELGVQRH